MKISKILREAQKHLKCERYHEGICIAILMTDVEYGNQLEAVNYFKSLTKPKNHAHFWYGYPNSKNLHTRQVALDIIAAVAESEGL